MGVENIIPSTCILIPKIGNYELSDSYHKYYYCVFQKCIYRIPNNPLGRLEKIRPDRIKGYYWFRIYYSWNYWFNIEQFVLIQELQKVLNRNDITLIH